MHFIDTDVPIYVHDLELTNALWCLFTKVSNGTCLPLAVQFSHSHSLNYRQTLDPINPRTSLTG
jgi:hypothetical protein